MRTLLTRIQNDLFDVGADLCTPVVENPQFPPLRVEQAYVDALEAACDDYNGRLESLRSFILPGGTRRAAPCSTSPARSYAGPSAPPGPRSRRTATR